MYFNHIMLTLALALTSEPSLDGVNLTPKPSSCVSLHQGRECFATIELTWQTPQVEDYCLFVETSNQPLKCWKQSNRGRIEFDFESAKSLAFHLKGGPQQVKVAQTKVSVGWVYNSSNKKRRWRIF